MLLTLQGGIQNNNFIEITRDKQDNNEHTSNLFVVTHFDQHGINHLDCL